MAESAKGIFLNRNRYLLFTLAAGILLGCGPLLLNPYWLKFCSFLLISLILACSWNLLGGYCRYFSFGHGVFFGLGAYVIAIAWVRFAINFYLAILLGGVSCVLLALIMAPLLRLRGFNFALATLALLEAMRVVFKKWSFTRGLKSWDVGWSFPPFVSDNQFYGLIVLVFVAMLLSFILFLSSSYGMASAAFREDDLMAKGIGINTTLCKVMAFALSSFWVGIIGAIYAPMISYISTQSIFGLAWSVKPIIVSIFGGLATLMGPIVGGVILIFVDQLLWERFLEFHTLIYGVILVAIVLFLPNGLMSYRDHLLSPLSRLLRQPLSGPRDKT
jgi:branched-chain amino acid transport system permease protein